MLWKTYRDQLTLILIVILVGFLGYSVYTGKGAEIIIGAIITWLGLIIQFYYRKREGEDSTNQTPPTQ